MKLSDLKLKSFIIKRDGEFDILAQCDVKKNRRIMSFLDDIKFLKKVLENKNITCLICLPEFERYFKNSQIGLIISSQARLDFFEIHNSLSLVEEKKLDTIIGKKCVISPNSCISPFNVEIGDNVIIQENVIINENVIIGSNSIIRSGCILGGVGFEFKRTFEEKIVSIVHRGKVILGNDVELKEYCTIHKAVFDWDYSKIDSYSKIDAHSHIGHGTKVGKRVLIGSHSNLAGNISVGNDVFIGPGVTISNRLSLGNNCRVSLGSVVTKDVEKYKVVTGNFAINHEDFLENLKSLIQKK